MLSGTTDIGVEILCRAQGAVRPIGWTSQENILSIDEILRLDTLKWNKFLGKNKYKIFSGPRGIKAHWVNSLRKINFDNRDYSEEFSTLTLNVSYWWYTLWTTPGF